MAYKQQPGRGPMMKTGRGIPKELMGPDAAKMAGGPEFDLINAAKKVAKKVGQRISAAHERGSNKYYTNTGSERNWSDFGGGGGSRSQTTYNPVNYLTGFAQGLTSGESTSSDALNEKQRVKRLNDRIAANRK